MANLVVISDTNSISVDFGVYGVNLLVEATKASFSKVAMTSVYLKSDHVEIFMADTAKTWDLDLVGNYFIVDSVNGVAPVSLSDLYDKIKALRA